MTAQDKLIAKMRHRAARCGRLAVGLKDDDGALLRQLAGKIEADTRRLEMDQPAANGA